MVRVEERTQKQVHPDFGKPCAAYTPYTFLKIFKRKAWCPKAVTHRLEWGYDSHSCGVMDDDAAVCLEHAEDLKANFKSRQVTCEDCNEPVSWLTVTPLGSA